MRKAILNSIFAMCAIAIPTFGHSDDARRIEEILDVDRTDSRTGTVYSEHRANVNGCMIEVTHLYPGSCENGDVLHAEIELIDLGVLDTSRDSVNLEDSRILEFGWNLYIAPRYHYRPLYGKSLLEVHRQMRRIGIEEENRFKGNMISRDLAISERVRNEIDPMSYSMSVETEYYCSGAVKSKPLPPGIFGFLMSVNNVGEFMILIERFAQNCGANENG